MLVVCSSAVLFHDLNHGYTSISSTLYFGSIIHVSLFPNVAFGINPFLWQYCLRLDEMDLPELANGAWPKRLQSAKNSSLNCTCNLKHMFPSQRFSNKCCILYPYSSQVCLSFRHRVSFHSGRDVIIVYTCGVRRRSLSGQGPRRQVCWNRAQSEGIVCPCDQPAGKQTTYWLGANSKVGQLARTGCWLICVWCY